jgi:hypothetical protein
MTRASPAADTAPAPSTNPDRAATCHAAARSRKRASVLRKRASVLMNVLLSLVQSLLAVALAASGVLKTHWFREQLSSRLPWVSDVPVAVVRLIGLAAFTASLGQRLQRGPAHPRGRRPSALPYAQGTRNDHSHRPVRHRLDAVRPHSTRLVEAFRDALVRVRDGEDLIVEDLDTAADLLLTVRAANGDSPVAEVMTLFRQVFQGHETGRHRSAPATSPSHPTYSDPFHKGSL